MRKAWKCARRWVLFLFELLVPHQRLASLTGWYALAARSLFPIFDDGFSDNGEHVYLHQTRGSPKCHPSPLQTEKLGYHWLDPYAYPRAIFHKTKSRALHHPTAVKKRQIKQHTIDFTNQIITLSVLYHAKKAMNDGETRIINFLRFLQSLADRGQCCIDGRFHPTSRMVSTVTTAAKRSINVNTIRFDR